MMTDSQTCIIVISWQTVSVFQFNFENKESSIYPDFAVCLVYPASDHLIFLSFHDGRRVMNSCRDFEETRRQHATLFS